MRALSLVVAALLLTCVATVAVAAEEPGQKSKTAQKILTTLNMVGINSQDVKDLVAQADTHVEKGYFYLDQTKAMGGDFSLRFNTERVPSMRQMELHYALKDSPLEFTAHTNSAMLTYHIQLER